MMTTAQTANRLVRDTTMCGDPNRELRADEVPAYGITERR